MADSHSCVDCEEIEAEELHDSISATISQERLSHSRIVLGGLMMT